MREKIMRSPGLRLALYALRGALSYIFFIVVLHFAERRLGIFRTEPMDGYRHIVNIVCHIAILPMIFYSTARAFALCDEWGCATSAKVDEQGVAVRWRDIVGTPVFAVQLLTMLVLYVLFPLDWGYGVLISFLALPIPPEPMLAKMTLAPVLLLLIALMALAHRSARHEWQRIRHERAEHPWKYHKKGTLRAMLGNETGVGNLCLRLIGIAALYSLGSLAASGAVVLLYPIISVALQFWYVTIVAIAVFTLPEYLISLSKRRKLIKKMMRICKEQGYELSPIRKPYASLLFAHKGANFTVTVSGKTYDCKLLSHHALPTMKFDYEGGYELILSLKFRFMSRGRGIAHSHEMGTPVFRRKMTYAFESEHQRVLIVCPVPAHTLIAGPNGGTPLDTGAHIGEYRLFNTTGFLGVLERNCLDR